MAGNAPKFKRVPRLYETGAKVRNVIFLIYMEDLEAVGKCYGDIIAYLDSKHVKAVVSPVHDRDTFTRGDVWNWCVRHLDSRTNDIYSPTEVNDVTGDIELDTGRTFPFVGKPKKAHVHVGVCSKSQRNAEEWREFMMDLLPLRVQLFEKMEDYIGFVRYCAHLDSPDKAAYAAMDVIGIAGADLSALLRTDEHTKVANFKQLVNFCRQRNIANFHTLVDLVADSGDFEMLDTLNHYGGMMASYFSSKRWAKMDKAMANKAKALSSSDE